MKKILIAALLLPMMALAQTYPSPTFNIIGMSSLNENIGLTGSNLAANCSLTIPSTNYCVNQFTIGGASPFDKATLNDPSAFVNGMSIVHNYGGGFTGGRQTFYVQSTLAGASGAGNTNHNYVAGEFYGQAASGDGGTASTSNTAAQGAVFALNPIAVAYNGATNLLELTGAEFDVSAQSGSSMWYKAGLTIAEVNNDAVQGTVYDTAIGISNESGMSGWKNGILFGPMNGAFPIASTGCVICSTGSGTAATGIDFSSLTLTNFLHGPGGFFVNGSGGVVASTGVFSSSLNATSGTFSSTLSAAYSSAAIATNDTSSTGTANLLWLKNGASVWNFYNTSSTGLFNLGRYVGGTLTDNPISVSNSTGIVTFADGVAGSTSGSAPSCTSGLIGSVCTATTSGTSLTSGTTASIASVSIPSGNWDVTCSGQFTPSSTVSSYGIGVASSATSLGGLGNSINIGASFTSAFGATWASPVVRLSLSTTTTYYCTANTTFSGTMTANGLISAKRTP